MSQSLPIPVQRWLSLLLCAITAAAITVFVSNISFVQQAYASWGSILNTSPALHYSFAFLAGIGIKLMLDKFYISHAKRSIGFSWKYPPITIAVWFSVIAILVYVFISERYQGYLFDDELLHASLRYLHITIFACALYISFQEPGDKAKKVFTKSTVLIFLLLAICLVISGYCEMPWPLISTFILLYSIAVILRMRVNCSSEVVSTNNDIALSDSDNEFSDLEDFRAWFKDDSIIKNTDKLEQDLKVYANRITERLRNGGDKYEQYMAQHIALCGPFGCGKSSIVAAIANELKKSKKVEAELSDEEKLKVARQNKINWIHSDISTWGAASGSVAHVVLSHIIDDISQHLDMCAFRALPKHYTEALKSGGSFFQFASTLLAGPINIEQSFQKLNDVLEVTNHKLLITLQDVDRGTDDESAKRLNDIAALLDRLKDRKLSHINFIIAMGNTKIEHIEVLGKIADYVETIVEQDFRDKLCKWAELSTKEIFNKEMVLTNEPFIINFNRYTKLTSDIFSEERYLPGIIASNLIISMRMLKRIMRRVDKCWVNEKLLGEVAFDSLMLLMTLRELKPVLFNQFISNYPRLLNGTSSHINPVEGSRSIKEMLHDLVTNNSSPIENKVLTSLIECLVDLPDHLMEAKGNFAKKDGRDYLQGIGNSQYTVNYLNRILLEAVPKNELRDQEVLKYFKTVSPENAAELANHICTDHRWLVSFERFNDIFGVGDGIEDKNKRKSLAFAILDNKQAEKSGLFLPSSIFENTLLRTVVIEGHFEEVLNKLVGMASTQALLFRILTWHYDSLFIARELPSLFVKKDSKGDYFDVEELEDRHKIAEKAKSFTQNIDFRKFLIENLDQLNMESIEVIIKYLVFTQFDDSKFNFNEKRMENILSLCLNSVSANAILLLINNAQFSESEAIYFRQHPLKVTTDQKVDLKNKIQCFQHQDITENQKFKVINNLGL
ncbi:P-loop NTPase fold protein [Pseudoalteromonas ostreae]